MVMSALLTFIYTGSSKVTEDGEDPDLQMTADLLVAAERYQLEILKSMCESILASNVTTENCLQLLSLSDMHQALLLKESTMKVVIGNMKFLMGTAEWKDFAKNGSHLFEKILEAVAERKN